jgi:hypothetical protein
MIDGTGRFTFNGIDETGAKLYDRNINEFGHMTSPYNLIVKFIDAVNMHLLPVRGVFSVTRSRVCNMHLAASKLTNNITRAITRTVAIIPTVLPRNISKTIRQNLYINLSVSPVLKTVTRAYTVGMSATVSRTRSLIKYITGAMHITPKIRTGIFVLKTTATKLMYNNGRDVK